MTTPATPVLAATVVLVRDGDPWECFMVRRHVRSDFAADVYVFPGGKVDPEDYSPKMPAVCDRDGLDDDSPDWLALRVAAIRELFEEVGVLLARRDGYFLPIDRVAADRLGRERHQVHDGLLSLFEVTQREDCRLALDALVPFSRWVTPVSMPRRFDTVFFLAPLPPGQEPLHDAVETSAGEWINPATALQRSARGEFPLVFATEKHLQRLAQFDSLSGLLGQLPAADLRPVTPRVVVRGGETAFLLPGDPGYDDEATRPGQSAEAGAATT